MNLNNSDVDVAARHACTQRGEVFSRMWSEVRRDLAYQQYIGLAVMRVHVEVGSAAVRRRGGGELGESMQDSGQFLRPLQLGQVDVLRDTSSARKYGAFFLARFGTWFATTFFAPDIDASGLRWVSFFLPEVWEAALVLYDKASKTWFEPDDRPRGALLDTDAAQLSHWVGRLVRAYVLASGGMYASTDARHESSVLQVKMPLRTAAAVEEFLAARVPGAVCGGRSRSWAAIRL